MKNILLSGLFLIGVSCMDAICVKYPGFVFDADLCRSKCVSSTYTNSCYDKDRWVCLCCDTQEECPFNDQD